MNLKGLCLYYKNIDDGVWRRFELKGYVPYQHSFLVRCGRVNSKQILHADMKLQNLTNIGNKS